MLYIISFQSISCREASPTSPRPHAAPPEGSSARAEVAGLPIGHSLNLPPGFPHVAQLGPLAGSRGGFSGRFLETILFGSASQSSDQSSHRSSPQSSTRFSSRCSALSSGRSSPQSSTRFPSRCSALSSGRYNKTILKPARGAVFNWAFGAATKGGLGGSRKGAPGGPQSSFLGRSITRSSMQSFGLSFATATLPTDTSVPFQRGKTVIYHPFATATLPTSTSGASPRGKAVIYHPFATTTLPTGTPVPSPRAEQSNNLSQTGL